MSILIKGMQMPNDCFNCPFKVSNGIISGRRMEFECVANGYATLDDYQYDGKPSNCPLIEIPTPHGRLIDADIMQRVAYQKNFDGVIGNWALLQLNYYLEEKAQTILEAEE